MKRIVLSLFAALALLLPSFTVAQTSVVDTILVGDTTDMTLGSNLPFTSFSGSYTQQLVLGNELNGAILITGLDLYCGNSGIMGRPCTVYLANTFCQRLNSLVPFGALFQLVATDTLGTDDGWNHIEFDEPFYYTGFGNLVVAFDCPYAMSGAAFYSESTQNISRYFNNRLEYLLPTSSTSGTPYRNIMRFHTRAVEVPADSCPVPELTVESIGDSAVTVASGSWGTASGGWTVECIADGDTEWHTGDLMGGISSCTIEGLNPNTHYTFRCINLCNDTTIISYKHILTSCTPTATPIAEDFDASWSVPDCWHAAPGSAGNTPNIVSTYSHSAPQSVRLQGGSLVLPLLDTPTDSLELAFWAKNGTGNSSLNLYVGVVVDPLDFTTFVPVDTIAVSRYDNWVPVVVRFDRLPAIPGRLAIVTANSSITYMYIDDVEVNRIVPCPTIMTVGSDHITDTAAVIRWFDTFAISYDVAYGPAGFAIDSSHIVYNIHTDSLLLSGLDPYTSYDVYVRSLCGNVYTNWSPVHTFRTLCSLIDTLPYREDFDSYTGNPQASALPCWGGHVGMNTVVINIPGGSHSGNRALRWEFSNYESVVNQYAVLPAINTAALPLNTLQLSFWAKNTENIYHMYDVARMVVGVMNDPAEDSTFSPVDTLTIVGDDWHRYDVPLSGYRGTGKYVVVRTCPGVENLNNGWIAMMDDIALELAPECTNVTGVRVTTLTATSTTVQWDSQSDAVWQTYIDTLADAVPETDTTHLTSPTTTFDGLATGTPYYVWVRSICTIKNDTAEWEGPLQVVPGVWNMRANKNDTLTMCGVTLYDNGGHDAIFSTQHSTLVIHPDRPGHLVSVSGMCNIGTSSSFVIYDGVGTSGPVLWTKAVNTGQFAFNFGPVISETGSVTLYFEADFMENRDGFEFNVSCIPDTCIIHQLQLDTAVAPSDTTLALAWRCNGSSHYEVEYGPVGFTPGNGTSLATDSSSLIITGLSSLDRREVYVRSICGIGDTGNWARGIFATEPCNDAVFRDNFDTNMAYSPAGSMPIGYNGYYSYVQTLVAPAHLAGLEEGITAMAFRPTNHQEGDHLKNVSVWLANVADTALNDGFLVPDNEHYFVKVVDSANFCHTATSDWQTIHFDRPFRWDGQRRLLVAVLSQDSGEGMPVSYAGHYRYNDLINSIYRSYQVVGYFPIDIDSAHTYTSPYYVAYGSFITGDLRLFTNTCDMPVCNAPVIETVSGTQESITLTWHGEGSSYQLFISPDTPGAGMVSVDSNSYTFSGLSPSITYQISLRQDCSADSLGYSSWAVTHFTTSSTGGIADTPFDSLHAPLVYPNPATSKATIQSHYPLAFATLTDMTGRHTTMVPVSIGNDTYTLSLAGLPQGAYFLTLTTDDGHQHTLKLVKK